MNNTWVLSHRFILSLKEDDIFFLGEKEYKVIKKTLSKIILLIDDEKFNIFLKKCDDFFYLHSRSVKSGNRSYPLINALLRDIEGYIIYLYHTPILGDKQKKFKEILDRNSAMSE
jgi:hypothetical protein